MASIRQRGENSYQITVSNGYDSKGKKLTKQKTITIDPKLTDRQREKELQKQATLFEDEVKSGTYLDPSKLSLSDFITKWLDKRENDFEAKTIYRYKGMLNGRINKAIGHLKLDQINPMHLLDFYANLQESGIREDGKEGALSAKTIQHYHRVLSVLFNDAVSWNMIKENPCSRVKPPKVVKKEMNCLDERQVPLLIEALESEPLKYKTLITLSLMTGCRRGELGALQWDRIDLISNTVLINKSVSYTPDSGVIIKDPKTKSSIRKIAIPESTTELLKQYRKWWLEEKLKVGDQWQKAAKEEAEKNKEAWIDPEYVFTTWNGYVIHPDTITDIFNKFIERHNLPDIRLHDLRHTAATLLIHSGLNIRAVAARLGHENPNVTLATYSHALLSADQQAADVMGSFIKKEVKEAK